MPSKTTDAILAEMSAKMDKLSKIESDMVTIKTSLEEIKKQNSDLEKKLDEKVEKIEKRITRNEKKFNTLQKKIDDDLEAFQKSHEVIVEGIPVTYKKSLIELYDKICTAIGLNEDGIRFTNEKKTFALRSSYTRDVKLYLLRSKDGKTNSLLIKFSSILQRIFHGSILSWC